MSQLLAMGRPGIVFEEEGRVYEIMHRLQRAKQGDDQE